MNNVNDIGVKLYLTNNDNVNVDRYAKSKSVDMLAGVLAGRFNNPGYTDFYCKVAYHLSEARIWQHVETAEKGKNPARLFSWLCKRDMGRV